MFIQYVIAIGIGRATSKAFAAEGYNVIVTDILAEEGAGVVNEIVTLGQHAEFQFLDVRSTEMCRDVVNDIITRYGSLDTIIANAGVAYKISTQNLTDEKWDETFEINLKGMLRIIRPALPKMKERKSGTIICLTSLMGLAYGWDEHVQYSASKAGVIGMMRGLAVELAPYGIRVNCIAPGYIRTAQLLSGEHSMGEENASLAANSIPLRRLGEPEDIADVSLFLSSNASRYITGQTIVVDGGLLVGRN